MLFSTWWNKLSRRELRKSAEKHHQARESRRLRFDLLEDRLALATIGDADPTFGSGIMQSFTFSSAVSQEGRAVALQSDGKIVMAGLVKLSTDNDFGVIRVNADGSLDSSFSSDGKRTIAFDLGTTGNRDDEPFAIAVQSDGKIVVAGVAERTSSDTEMAIARLNSDGSYDTSFGTGGKQTFNLGVLGYKGLDGARALAIQSDGKILVGGYAHNNTNIIQAVVLRLTTSGALDSSFNSGGRANVSDFTDSSGADIEMVTALAIQSNGKILAAGTATDIDLTTEIGLARFNADGTQDTTFGDDQMFGGTNGDSDISLSGPNLDETVASVKIASDGKIYVGGMAETSSTTAVYYAARFTSSGLIDSAFGGLGIGVAATYPVAGNVRNQAFDMALQSDGKIVLVGNSPTGSTTGKMGVARLLTDGTADLSFGPGGARTYTNIIMGNNFAEARAMAIQPDGSIVLVGSYTSSFQASSVRSVAAIRIIATPPVVTLTTNATTMTELAGVTLSAKLSYPPSSTVTVNLSYSGTAVRNTDYTTNGTASPTQIVISSGSTEGTIALQGIADTIVDPNETIVVDVSSVTNGAELTTQRVTITETDVFYRSLTSAVDNVNVRFTSATNYEVQVNGGAYVAASTTTTPTLYLSGGGEVDTLVISLPTTADRVSLREQNLSVDGVNLDMNAYGFEKMYVFGDATDQAVFNDTSGDDLFWALSAYSIMASKNYSYLNEIIGFGPTVDAIASTGFDVAQLYGTAAAETYVGTITNAALTGSNVTFKAYNFDQFYGYSGGGTDTATLNGSNGDDVMYGLSAYSILVAAGIQQYVVGISSVTGNSGGGSADIAILYDSQGDDTFVAGPTTARLFGTGYSNIANDFDQVHANAYGGNDTATLDGSSGNDTFYGYNTYAQLYSSGVYYLQTNRFELTHVNLSSGSGNDLAFFFDGTGSDQFTAAGNQAENLYSNGARNRVNAFDAVYAYSKNGGTNRKTVTNPLAFTMAFNGTWV